MQAYKARCQSAHFICRAPPSPSPLSSPSLAQPAKCVTVRAHIYFVSVFWQSARFHSDTHHTLKWARHSIQLFMILIDIVSLSLSFHLVSCSCLPFHIRVCIMLNRTKMHWHSVSILFTISRFFLVTSLVCNCAAASLKEPKKVEVDSNNGRHMKGEKN